MNFVRARTPTPAPRIVRRRDAAAQALEICTHADRLADEAMHCVDVADERLDELLLRRDEVLQSLAEHIVSLRLSPPTADSRVIASSERAADDAENLVTAVCAALDRSHRTTLALAARVAERATELRTQLAEIQRAGSAQHAYATPRSVALLDSRR